VRRIFSKKNIFGIRIDDLIGSHIENTFTNRELRLKNLINYYPETIIQKCSFFKK
tara:strand:+ start:316 stop:480 length:165 start_codon:yes stop_codon:yes gene_type:complete